MKKIIILLLLVVFCSCQAQNFCIIGTYSIDSTYATFSPEGYCTFSYPDGIVLTFPWAYVPNHPSWVSINGEIYEASEADWGIVLTPQFGEFTSKISMVKIDVYN